MNIALNACPKPQHKRNSKTAKQRGYISAKTRKLAAERAKGKCEWCGWVNGFDRTGVRMGLQAAHLIRRWNVTKTTETEIAFLCGPSVNSGTCHWKVDYTATGKAWALAYHKKLVEEANHGKVLHEM